MNKNKRDKKDEIEDFTGMDIENQEKMDLSIWVKRIIPMLIIIIVLLICLVLSMAKNHADEKKNQTKAVSVASETEQQKEDTKSKAEDSEDESSTLSEAQESEAASQESEVGESDALQSPSEMAFTDVQDVVTAKDTTNLRDIPSQGEESNVIAIIKNGEAVNRTGTSDGGWSRLDYNGQVCYAVTNYLTTDLSTQEASGTDANIEGTGDGLKTKFTDCSDTVTAKIEVNLRALPSVTNPDATVMAVLHNGETVARTGVNDEFGWSKVDYNGQTLYCITSYITTVQ